MRHDLHPGWTVLIGFAAVWLSTLSPLCPQTHQDALQQASQWIARGRFAQAEALLRPLLHSGGSPKAHYLMGFTLVQLYKLDEAESHLREAVRQDPGQPEWLHALAKALVEQGRNRAAFEVLGQAIKLRPQAKYHFARAMCALNQGDSRTAESELRRCLGLDPGRNEAFFKLGTILIDRGDYPASIPLLQNCLKGNPGHLEARFSLGLAQSRRGGLQEAVEAFEEVLKEVPGHVGALYNLGRTLMRLNRPQEGRKRLQEFRAMSQLEDQIDFFRKAVRKNPSHVEGRLKLAQMLLQAGNADAAFEQLMAARRLAPRQAPIYRLMAEALRRLGRAEDAQQAEKFARSLEGQQ
ncbi:MAG: tetratricopeptide repeat protein [Acidobacteriota bacterium]